jgi:hypothetical protein
MEEGIFGCIVEGVLFRDSAREIIVEVYDV